MWYVLGAVALVAVIVAAISVLRRPSAEDESSVRHYHSALGTLEHLTEQNVRPVRPAGRADGPGDEAAEPVAGQPRFYRRPDATGPLPVGVDVPPEVEPAPVLPPSSLSEREAAPVSPRSSGPIPPAVLRSSAPAGGPLVFDEARLRDHAEPDHAGLQPRPRMDRAQRHALDSMNRRPRRATLAVVVATVVVLFVVLAVIGSQRSHKHTTGAVTPSTAQPSASTASTASTPGKSRLHRTTATTAPAQLVAASSTSNTALYVLGGTSYRLTLAASGPCWVSATSASTGSTLWTGTMQPGGTQDIPATGTTRVEFGTLAVTVTVDGVAVLIPSSLQSPFVLTFESSSSASAGAGAPSTTAPAGG